MRCHMSVLALVVVCLGLGGRFLQAQEAQAEIVPRFEESSCNYSTPAGVDVTCGYIVVPEDHSNPEGETIRLALVILHSTSDTPAPDPIISLTGGPGGSTLEYLPFTFRQNYRAFLETRDFIMFDQRGVGLSEPSLNCPDLLERNYQDAARLRSAQEAAQDDTASILDCQQTLIDSGEDLTVYTTAQNAADVADIRLALGYEEWNLFGVSYGTKLALTTIRDFPEGIRSVMLDSVYPLQANLYTERAANQQRAFDLLFDSCAADSACAEAYPHLEKAFYDLINRLNDSPVPIETTHTDYGFRFNTYVTGEMIASTVFGDLYVKNIIPTIPAFIDRLVHGDESELSFLAQNFYDRSIGLTEGMYYSIQCGEELRFADEQDALTSAEELNPALRDAFSATTSSLFDLCGSWQAYPADRRENESVQSTITTLVLSGEFDPITPPSWGQLAADDLENSFFYTFPSVGHGAIRTDSCAQSIALQFIENPTLEPNADCISEIEPPPFELP